MKPERPTMKPERKRPSRRPGGSPRPTPRPLPAGQPTAPRSGGRPPSPGRHRAGDEEIYHGLRACQSLFARRPDDIVRVYLTAVRRSDFAALLAWCARARRGFQIVEQANLERLTGSVHHEGVAIVARAARRWRFADLQAAIAGGTVTGPLIHLDGVHNPHNVGSILRSAAHFGAGAVTGRQGDLPGISPAAARVAQGAADAVPLCDFDDPAGDLGRLKQAGWVLVGTSSRHGDPYRARPLPPRAVLVFGSEGSGMSPDLERAVDRCVRIPGTGVVESLNVAVACGILLAEWWAAHEPRPGVPSPRRGSIRRP